MDALKFVVEGDEVAIRDRLSRIGLCFLDDIEWLEVFSLWHEKAVGSSFEDSGNKRIGREDTWEDWRENYLIPLHLPELPWYLCETKSPYCVVPSLEGGPFQSWMELYYGEDGRASFFDLEMIDGVRNAPAVKRVVESLPKEVFLISILHRDRVRVIEGMHKCIGIAQAVAKGINLSNIRVKLVLGEFPDDKELPIIKRNRVAMRLHQNT